MERLNRQFFTQPTLSVARQLIGTILVVNHPHSQKRGLIIETEAYLGTDDLASHASRGRTKRTAPMFGPAGYTYIYLVYGLHWCLNLVTEAEGYPAAVLIRAVAPLQPKADLKIANGPGKTCRWLGLNGTWNQIDATADIIYIERDDRHPQPPVVTGPRIGVGYAGAWAAKPWRFGWANHPALSQRINHA